ncbi:sepiapterin reductase-like [Sycon ciliatum]|uniref:sepiapterin reductase-like n=1 Tax=Sycon ciliatum TaxID=27933 RepID=UPI0031F6EEE0
MSIFNQKCAFFVTGASRGYGRAIALALAKELAEGELLGEGSLLVGTSRCQERLDSLKEELAFVCPKLVVRLRCVEISDVASMAEVFCDLVKVEHAYDVAAIVHNAGSAGDLTVSCLQQTDAGAVQKALDLNINSLLQLNGAFLRQFESTPTTLFVVNITSLLAVEAFPGLHIYCLAKAARDMYIKVLAKEQPSVRCLNWAPGPMPTDLFDEIKTQSFRSDIRDSFAKMADEKSFVTCAASSSKLMGLLRDNKFESGSHIDIYDL